MNKSNDIVPFKGRAIDPTKRVLIYRNLHKPGRTYSVKQDGLIVGHGTKITVNSVNFIVNEGGRQRVLREKRKNVHAFIEGKLTADGLGMMATNTGARFAVPVTYNPYQAGHFYSVVTTTPVFAASNVIINETGISATGIYSGAPAKFL